MNYQKASTNKEELKLTFAGDIVLADTCFDNGFGFGTQYKKVGNYDMMTGMEKPFLDSDYSVANLEFLISNQSNKEGIKKSEFLADKDILKALSKLKIDCFSVANNHVLDHGENAYLDTLENLNSVNIKHIGSANQKYLIKEINDIKIGILSASAKIDSYSGDSKKLYNQIYFPNEIEENSYLEILNLLNCDKKELFEKVYNKKGNKYFINIDEARRTLSIEIKMYEIIFSAICDKILPCPIYGQIETMKEKCDFAIVCLHWGDEYVNVPANWQVRFAHSLADAGANIIVGCHSHSIQGKEVYNGVPIIYSLGNYYFNSNNPVENEGLIYHIELKKDDLGNVIFSDSFTTTRYNPENMTISFPYGIGKYNVEKMQEYSENILKMDEDDYISYVNNRLESSREYKKKFLLMNMMKINPAILFTTVKDFVFRRLQNIRKNR